MKRGIIAAILVSCLLFTTGCSKEDEATSDFLQSVRDSAGSEDNLIKAYSCFESIKPLFMIYNNATYQTAKSTAKIGIAIEAEFFPTAEWQGVEMLGGIKEAEFSDVLLTSMSDSAIDMIFHVNTVENGTFRKSYLYRVRYSIAADQMTELEEIYSY